MATSQCIECTGIIPVFKKVKRPFSLHQNAPRKPWRRRYGTCGLVLLDAGWEFCHRKVVLVFPPGKYAPWTRGVEALDCVPVCQNVGVGFLTWSLHEDLSGLERGFQRI